MTVVSICPSHAGAEGCPLIRIGVGHMSHVKWVHTQILCSRGRSHLMYSISWVKILNYHLVILKIPQALLVCWSKWRMSSKTLCPGLGPAPVSCLELNWENNPSNCPGICLILTREAWDCALPHIHYWPYINNNKQAHFKCAYKLRREVNI